MTKFEKALLDLVKELASEMVDGKVRHQVKPDEEWPYSTAYAYQFAYAASVATFRFLKLRLREGLQTNSLGAISEWLATMEREAMSEAKVPFTLARGLHDRLAEQAKRENVSVDDLIHRMLQNVLRDSIARKEPDVER